MRASFDDRLRGDDRRAGVDAPPSHADKPAVLRRRTISWLALLSFAGIVYGSLVPFQPHPARSWTWHLLWHAPVPSDAIANFLLYIPVGIFARLLVRRRRSPAWLDCIAALVMVGGLSFFVESMQTLLPQRVASWTDVMTNLAGAAFGLLLAPAFQRVLRNQHAWLHGCLRACPFTAAAAAAVTFVATAGLVPFDVHPTPGHLLTAWKQAAAAPLWPWWGSVGGTQAVDKVIAAGAYGLVAFLMVLAARQLRRRVADAAWYGFSRTLAMVAAIELLQMFTISHVADGRDLLMGWSCALLGTLGGAGMLLHRRGALPPAGQVLRMIVGLVAAAILLRGLAGWTVAGSPSTHQSAHWLPLAASFHRPWDTVLASYAACGLRALLIAGVVALWYRSQRFAPPPLLVLLTPLAWALLEGGVATHMGRAWDTAGVPLSLLAGVVVISVDRAFFSLVRKQSG